MDTGIFTRIAILLEQSQNHYINLQIKGNPSRFVLNVAILIPAILFSNLYKGDNITKLTHPLTSKPYEKLQDILSHGFQIYQQSDFIYNNFEFSLSISMPPMMSRSRENRIVQSMAKVNKSRKFILNALTEGCTGTQGIAILQPESSVHEDTAWLRSLPNVCWDDVGIGTESLSVVWRGLSIKNNVDLKVSKTTTGIFETGISTKWVAAWSTKLALQGRTDSPHYAPDKYLREYLFNRYKPKRKNYLVLHGSILTLFVVIALAWLISFLIFYIELI